MQVFDATKTVSPELRERLEEVLRWSPYPGDVAVKREHDWPRGHKETVDEFFVRTAPGVLYVKLEHLSAGPGLVWGTLTVHFRYDSVIWTRKALEVLVSDVAEFERIVSQWEREWDYYHSQSKKIQIED